MKKIRNSIKKLKEGFLIRDEDLTVNCYFFFYLLFLIILVFILECIAIIIAAFISEILGYTLGGIFLIFYAMALFVDKIEETLQSRITCPLFVKLFERYGIVLSKEDWKKIKKKNPKVYKDLITKKSIGYCYMYSWLVALYVEGAQLVYCSIDTKDKIQTGHSVVLKDNFIYDTNSKMHCRYDEYLKLNNAKIYKIFGKEEYYTNDFFDNIREGFVEWCSQNNVYCDPQ